MRQRVAESYRSLSLKSGHGDDNCNFPFLSIDESMTATIASAYLRNRILTIDPGCGLSSLIKLCRLRFQVARNTAAPLSVEPSARRSEIHYREIAITPSRLLAEWYHLERIAIRWTLLRRKLQIRKCVRWMRPRWIVSR